MSQDYLDKLIEKDKAGTQIQSIPLHDTELRGITIDDPITVEGNPINFSTKNEQNAIQTVVDLNPIQDLHGYSKPWVGGAGKNLLPMTVEGIKAANTSGSWNGNAYVLNNIVFTILTDSDNNVIGIKANGTTNSTIEFVTYASTTNIFAAVSHTLTGCPNGGSNNTYKQDLYYYQNGDYAICTDYGSGGAYNLDVLSEATRIRTRIVIYSGAQIANKIFYPMLRLSSITDATFEPYTNICPILPHEEIKIGGCGKNLCKPKIINNTTVNGIAVNVQKDNSGNIIEYSIPSNTANANVNIVLGEFTPNKDGQYIFSGFKINNASNNVRTFIWNETLSQSVVGTINDSSIIVSLVKDNWYLVALLVNNGYTVPSTIIKPMILISTETDTSYEPYTLSNSLTLPLPEDVYGGTLNLETGELVVDRAYKVLTSSDILNASPGSATDSLGGKRITTAISNAKYIGSLTELSNIISNCLETVRADVIYNNNPPAFCISINDANQITFRANGADTIAKAQTYVTDNEVQVVYELSTPYTIQLTPAQLKLFKDVNNLNSSDYTTLTVTYHSNSMASLTPATDTTDGLLTAMDKRALDRTEETIEGNPIQFETESVQVAKSTIIDLEPIQDLHGFTKPWVGGAGDNQLNYASVTVSSVTFAPDSNDYISATPNNADVRTWGYAEAQYKLKLVAGTYNFIAEVTQATTIISQGISVRDINSTEIGGSNSILTTVGNHYFSFTLSEETEIGIMIKQYDAIARFAVSKSSITTWTPYTNICPISGRTEIGILGCGKNLLPNDIGWYRNNASNFIEISDSSTTRIRTTSFVIASGDYILSGVPSGSSLLAVRCYDRNKNSLPNATITNNTFILNNEVKYIHLLFGGTDYTSSTNAEFANANILLEKGNQVTGYEPYTESTSLQIQLGQTVYGGQLDVENGVLVVDRSYAEFDGSDDENWAYSDGWSKIYTSCFFIATPDTEIYFPSYDYKSLTNCDKCVCLTRNEINNADYISIGVSGMVNSASITIRVPKSVNDVSGLRTYLASNSFTVCYKLKTPTTISLTPEQVKLLQGVNTITTNADNITLTYRNGSVATLNDLESLYAKLKAYIDSLHSS